MMRGARLSSLVCLCLLAAAGPAVHAQAPRVAPGGDPSVDAARLPPREVQRLFDAYVAMQAQERLQLSDAQYPTFLPRLKALLDLRRRNLAARQSLLAELGRASGGPGDDRAIGEQLQRLRAFEQRSAVELAAAYRAIDDVLDLRQQARFRVFEDQVERRKMELLMRARENIRNRRRAEPR